MVAAVSTMKMAISRLTNELNLIAKSVTQTMSAAVVSRDDGHRREILPERLGQIRDEAAHLRGRVLRLGGRAHQAAADDHALGAGGGCLGGLLRRGDPESNGHRHVGVGGDAGDEPLERRPASAVRSPVVPDTETV